MRARFPYLAALGAAAGGVVAWILWLGWLGWPGGLTPRERASSRPGVPVASPSEDDLFVRDTVWPLRVELSPDAVGSLRKNPRKRVFATVREGGRTYERVRARLKGSVGSFRGLDDKPSFTLWFNQSDPAARFHGLRQIHLNNSVEDPSLLHEELGGEWFRSVGLPAPRATHARVELNGRSLGLYVLKEAFAPEFLARHFKNSGGNLYEPRSGGDVDSPMKLQWGGGRGQSDRRRLAQAALDPDPARRWGRLGEVLDADRFIAFMAMEIMICHRDGYSAARNNFRLYHDLDSDRFLFLPHGMDQLLEPADYPWEPASLGGLVARGMLESMEGRRAYEAEFRRLFGSFYQVELMTNRVNQILGSLAPRLSRAELTTLRREAGAVVAGIIARHHALARELGHTPETLLRFAGQPVRLETWKAEAGIDGMTFDRVPLEAGGAALRITARSGGAAAWVSRVLIPRGVYRFRARCKTTNATAYRTGNRQGAGIRLGGRLREGDDVLGTSDWKELAAEFEVSDWQELIELKCEFRADQGEVLFDASSLTVETAPHNSPKSSRTGK